MTIERAVVLQQDPDNYAVFVSVLGRFWRPIADSGSAGPHARAARRCSRQLPRAADTRHPRLDRSDVGRRA